MSGVDENNTCIFIYHAPIVQWLEQLFPKQQAESSNLSRCTASCGIVGYAPTWLLDWGGMRR